MLRWILLAGVLVCAGCADTGTASDDDGSAPPTSASTTTAGEPEPEPEPEPTEPETTQTRRNQPSIELPSAPIGGVADVDGANQCAPVSWLGRNPLPPGTKVTLGSPRFKSNKVFRLNQDACGDRRACTGVVWSGQDPEPCYVGARQLTTQGGDSVQLTIPARATCATDRDCRSLISTAGGSQVQFTPIELEPEPGPTDPPAETTDPPASEPTPESTETG